MTPDAPEVPCPYCSGVNRVDRVFCIRCRRRLIPLTHLDLSAGDFALRSDMDNLEVLADMHPLPFIADRFVVRRRERSLRSWLAANATRVPPRSQIYELIRESGATLGLEVLPEAYVAPFGNVNAFVSGRDASPLLVITSSALELLDEGEMRALLGHELAHVKSKHMTYHTLAESMARGASLVAPALGLGLVSLPVQMLLLSWHKESETSADRASILVAGRANFGSLMNKLAGQDAGTAPQNDWLSSLFMTHPDVGRRVQMADEFVRSSEYRRAVAKIGKRREMARVLRPFCSFCGARKPLTALYCKSCGKSQA